MEIEVEPETEVISYACFDNGIVAAAPADATRRAPFRS